MHAGCDRWEWGYEGGGCVDGWRSVPAFSFLRYSIIFLDGVRAVVLVDYEEFRCVCEYQFFMKFEGIKLGCAGSEGLPSDI